MLSLFASDLHLSSERPRQLRQFESLIDFCEQQVERLYLLGDLVEAWLGDDDDRPPNPLLVNGLRRLTQRGVEVTVIHGNRDFLMGEGFRRATDVQLLPESGVIDLHGRPALIMHGDALCTLDHEYQAIRRQIRAPEWQQGILALPLAERIALAERLRSQSIALSAQKDRDIMDVTPTAVVDVMRTNGVDLLIHGHTHRPGRHALAIDGRPAERIVLGDWYEDADYVLAASPGELNLLTVANLLGGVQVCDSSVTH